MTTEQVLTNVSGDFQNDKKVGLCDIGLFKGLWGSKALFGSCPVATPSLQIRTLALNLFSIDDVK